MAAFLAGLLAGCASITPSEQRGHAGAEEIVRAPAYQETVDIAGRLSIRYQENGSEQALHGSFTWSQRPEHILVSLLSPLGQTLAIIESTRTGALLRQPGQPPRQANDVNELTAQALGWPLPVAGLHHWLQGFAMGDKGLRAIASPTVNTMPQTSMQDGWLLQYASWNREAALPHPKRLDLQRTTEQAGDVEIRLIIDSFQPL
ncbi:MAG: lipoprotein insertase outer membrane protein LolB [Burkholderiaceae bacterium]